VLTDGTPCAWTFFGLFVGDHPDASGADDLRRLDEIRAAVRAWPSQSPPVAPAARSLLQDAAPVLVRPMDEAAIAAEFPERTVEEWREGERLSFFTPAGRQNRHVVLKAKEDRVARRHGTLLSSGGSMMLDDDTLCATVWMHGVFGAQLTIGNTSFHKLFSVSRDPYNVTRANGLRILVEIDGRWRLLATPSAFDIGLSDCRWLYRLDGGELTVQAVASGRDPAMVWEIRSDVPRRLLVVGHLVLGEREYEQNAPFWVDPGRARARLQPARDGGRAKHNTPAV
jgi:hypothetical protein